MVCQNTLLTFQLFESRLCLKFSKDSILDFSPLGLWTFGSQGTVYAKKSLFGFVLKQCLPGCFLCLISVFHLFVPWRSYFYVIIRLTGSFPSTYLSSRWSYSCSDTSPPLCLTGVLGPSQTIYLWRSFLRIFPPGPVTLFGRISWFV